MTTVTPYDKSSERKKKLDNEVALFIARDMQPFSVVEDAGFKSLLKSFDPRYELPSRKRLTDVLIPDLYKKAKANLKKLLSTTDVISITTDGWTSVANESYLGVTCHFLDKKLALRSITLDVLSVQVDEKAESLMMLLNDCFKYWEIETKVKHIVTDNAASMKAMVDLMGLKHFPCAAHSINLIVKNAVRDTKFEEVRLAINKAKDLVTFFHKSPKACQLLRKIKKQSFSEEGEIPAGKLIQYVSMWYP